MNHSKTPLLDEPVKRGLDQTQRAELEAAHTILGEYVSIRLGLRRDSVGSLERTSTWMVRDALGRIAFLGNRILNEAGRSHIFRVAVTAADVMSALEAVKNADSQDRLAIAMAPLGELLLDNVEAGGEALEKFIGRPGSFD